MIRARATAAISRSTADVFAFLDDFTKTPLWNRLCVSLRSPDDGQRGRGTRLEYRHRTMGREHTMLGELAVYAPPEHLRLRFEDAVVAIDVDFRITPTSATSSALEHSVEVVLKTVFARLAAPLVRASLARHVATETLEIGRLLVAAGGVDPRGAS